MLMITRRIGESIEVGAIAVTVLQMRGAQVRFGIMDPNAPVPPAASMDTRERGMRVVWLRVGEATLIGGNELIVLQMRGAQVRLGINAPRDVPVTTDRLRALRDQKAGVTCAG